MSTVLVATLAGLLVALLWGMGDWLSSRSAKKFSPYQVTFGSQLIGVILALALWLFADITMPNFGQFMALLAGSVLINVAFVFYVKALVDGAVGIVVPLSNGYALITVVLSAIFLSISFSLGQYAGILVIVAGAAVLAYEKNHNKIPLKQLHKDNILAMYATLIWGVGFFFMGMVVDELNWQTITFISEVISTLIVIPILYYGHKHNFMKAAKASVKSIPVLLIGCTGIGGVTVLYIGADYANNITIPTVLSTCSTLVAVGLGALFEHERLGIYKRLGAVMVVCGIVLLNIL